MIPPNNFHLAQVSKILKDAKSPSLRVMNSDWGYPNAMPRAMELWFIDSCMTILHYTPENRRSSRYYLDIIQKQLDRSDLLQITIQIKVLITGGWPDV